MDFGNHTQTLSKSSMLLNTELDLQPYFKKFIRKNQFDIKRPVGNTVKTEGSRARALIPVTTGMHQGRRLFLPAEPASQAPEECRLQTLITPPPPAPKAQFELSLYWRLGPSERPWLFQWCSVGVGDSLWTWHNASWQEKKVSGQYRVGFPMSRQQCVWINCWRLAYILASFLWLWWNIQTENNIFNWLIFQVLVYNCRKISGGNLRYSLHSHSQKEGTMIAATLPACWLALLLNDSGSACEMVSPYSG